MRKQVKRAFWSKPQGQISRLIATRGDDAAWQVYLAYVREMFDCWGAPEIAGTSRSRAMRRPLSEPQPMG